jgi:hypothetical protein
MVIFFRVRATQPGSGVTRRGAVAGAGTPAQLERKRDARRKAAASLARRELE